MSDANGDQERYYRDMADDEQLRLEDISTFAQKYLQDAVERLIASTCMVDERYRAFLSRNKLQEGRNFLQQTKWKRESAIKTIENLLFDLLLEAKLPEEIAQDIASMAATILASARTLNDLRQTTEGKDTEYDAEQHRQLILSL